MRRLVRILISVLAAALGVAVVAVLSAIGLLPVMSLQWRLAVYITAGVVGFIIGFLVAPKMIRVGNTRMEVFAGKLERIPASDVVLGTAGLVIGFLLASLLSSPIAQLSIPFVGNVVGVILSVILYIVLGLLGIRLALKNKEDILSGFHRLKESSSERRQARNERKGNAQEAAEEKPAAAAGIPKILDTSVIIDGRIAEVIETGFLEGPLVVSNYVLEELQHIADSSDHLRRERGRRGLDIINRIQTSGRIEVRIDNRTINTPKEVDAKLLVLTTKLRGCIVTNDYNLNKVAAVQGITVLNINDLANALRPVVIPGERMRLHVLKEGKEPDQGLAYLEDGTMVVIENGREYIGQTVDAVVTSVLQTAAGKMIFVRV
ncbi:MAG: TRAM domain-containing protein [Ndongobacter sp.]|nr:TRAM domain-containing protein [Ndongobacter sp.]